MSRVLLDKELNYIHEDLIKMSSMVEKQVYNSIEALKNQDVSLAEKVIENDNIVDEKQKDIEEKSIKLIAQSQPLATDLRTIFTAIKIVTDLERMADHATDIAKITKKLSDKPYIKKLEDIPLMATKVLKMIRVAVNAYIYEDVDAAYEICHMDDEVDSLYKQIFDDLFKYVNKNNESEGSNETCCDFEQISNLLFVCKYLERIADHTTNICEWTIYIKTGKYVDLNE